MIPVHNVFQIEREHIVSFLDRSPYRHYRLYPELHLADEGTQGERFIAGLHSIMSFSTRNRQL